MSTPSLATSRAEAAGALAAGGIGRVGVNAAATLVAQGWTAVLTLAVVPVQLRLLGAEAYGLISLLTSFEAFTQVIDMSLTVTSSREIARCGASAQDGELGRLTTALERLYGGVATALFLVLGIFVLCFGTGWLKAGSLSVALMDQAVVVFAAATAARIMVSYFRAVLEGLQQHVPLAKIRTVMATARLGGGAALLTGVTTDVRAFLLWYLFCFGAEAVALRWLSCRIVCSTEAGGWSILRESLKPCVPFMWRMGLLSLIVFGINQSDRLVMAPLLPLTQIGFYGFAKSLAGGLALFVTPVFSAAMPSFSRHHSAGRWDLIREEYEWLTRAVAALAIPSGLFLALYASDVLRLLGASQSVVAAPAMAAMAGGFVLYALSVPAYSIQLAANAAWIPLTVNGACLPLVVLGTWAAVRAFGITGAAAVYFALNIVIFFVAVPLTHRTFALSSWPRWLSNAVIPQGAVASCAALVAWRATAALPERSRLFAGAAVAALSACGLGLPSLHAVLARSKV